MCVCVICSYLCVISPDPPSSPHGLVSSTSWNMSSSLSLIALFLLIHPLFQTLVIFVLKCLTFVTHVIVLAFVATVMPGSCVVADACVLIRVSDCGLQADTVSSSQLFLLASPL